MAFPEFEEFIISKPCEGQIQSDGQAASSPTLLETPATKNSAAPVLIVLQVWNVAPT